MEENAFKLFLNSNPENFVLTDSNRFDCNDCKNFWLRKQPNLLKRVINIKCSNGKNFNDPDNFAECPYQSLRPCEFQKLERAIYCGGKTDIDLKAIFHNFSEQLSYNEKHFKAFYLSNTFIKVLEKNTFNGITFDEIDIRNCNNLKNITTDTPLMFVTFLK